MPAASLSHLIEVSDQQVNDLRARFLADYTTNHDEYNATDVDSIRNSDWPLQRFLAARKCNVEEALKMMLAALKWRKLHSVPSLTSSNFPKEYFQIGGVFTYGKDRNGSTMIILRVKVNKRINEWADLLKKFIAYLVEGEDLKNNAKDGKGITIIFDCAGAGITNVDIDMLSFIVTAMRDYYPYLLSSVLVYELPWILQYVFKLVQTWLPEDHRKLIHLVSHKDINEFVAEEELPDFMGGKNKMSYRLAPKDAPSAEDLAKDIGLRKKDVDKLLKHLEPYLNGA